MPAYHAALGEGLRGSVVALFELLSKFHDGPRKNFGIHQGGVSTVRFDVCGQRWRVSKTKSFFGLHAQFGHVFAYS
jgi:hypothetical protein